MNYGAPEEVAKTERGRPVLGKDLKVELIKYCVSMEAFFGLTRNDLIGLISKKQIAALTSGERYNNRYLYGCYTGSVMPPSVIFPRKNMNEHLKRELHLEQSLQPTLD